MAEDQQQLQERLDDAVTKGDATLIATLIKNGANPNVADTTGLGEPPLHYAARFHGSEVIEALIKNGANPNARPDPSSESYAGMSALDWAVSAPKDNRDQEIKTLIANGADPNATRIDGYTALHHASLHNQVNAARTLTESGANPNVQTNDGNTALHFATLNESTELVKLLVARGADPSMRDKHGFSALDIAAARKNKDVVAILTEAAQSSVPNAQVSDQGSQLSNEDKSKRVVSNLHAALESNDLQRISYMREAAYEHFAGQDGRMSKAESDAFMDAYAKSVTPKAEGKLKESIVQEAREQWRNAERQAGSELVKNTGDTTKSVEFVLKHQGLFDTDHDGKLDKDVRDAIVKRPELLKAIEESLGQLPSRKLSVSAVDHASPLTTPASAGKSSNQSSTAR